MSITKKQFGKLKGKSMPGHRAIGRMGRSQAVTTFGTGAIYELRTFSNRKATLHSVMVAGLDAWEKFRYDMPVVSEEVLARILGVSHFLLPPTESDAGWQPNPAVVPAVRFPRVLSCDKCGRIGRTGKEFADPGYGGIKCSSAQCGGRGVPFRLVVACHDKKDVKQPGHIEDFPFEWWAHRGREICTSPVVHLKSGASTTGLSGLALECRACQAPPQSLGSVFGEKALEGRRCHGNRPWLNDKEAGCSRPLRVLQRGASNTYFPVTASALSIPPYADRLFSLLSKGMNLLMLNGLKTGTFPVDAAAQMCRNIPGLDDPDVYSSEQIREALLVIAGKVQVNLPASEDEQRLQERNAIVKGRKESPEACDFVAEPITDLRKFPLLSAVLERVVMVHRLREVRALRGFHRVESTGQGDSYSVEVAPLYKKKPDWLPAIEVRGEGVYIELDEDLLKEWERRPAVLERVRIIGRNQEELYRRQERELKIAVSPREILIHTLSHLLMKQLSLECGYSANSLRERLYISRPHDATSFAGVLIYTASPAGDGTLGGLVSQGQPARLEPVLRAALLSAQWCSSDPLCGESKGQGIDALNLAACHACALVSETSCERRNTLLDRCLVVGAPGAPETGFFLKAMEGLE